MILDFIWKHKKGALVCFIILFGWILVHSVSSSASKSYFSEIEAIQNIEKVSVVSISDAFDGVMGAKRQDSFNDIKNGDKIEGDINGIPFEGKFQYCITWDSSILNLSNQNAVVIKVDKYLNSRTYKVPCNLVSFSARK